MNKKLNRFFVSMHYRAIAKGAVALELRDVNDVAVTFNVADESEIAVGVEATPDGEYTFANGKKIKVKGGVVTEIEVEEKPTETEDAKFNPEEKKADEGEEIDKNAKIAELEAELVSKNEAIAELEKQVEELKKQVEDNNKEMEKINDFVEKLGNVENHKEVVDLNANQEVVGDKRILFNKRK